MSERPDGAVMCDDPQMDDTAREELRSLRARVYGPDADTAADPSARVRLSELEERFRSVERPTPTPPVPKPGLSLRDSTAVPVAPVAPVAVDLDELFREPEDLPPQGAPPAGLFARVRPTPAGAVVWAASLVVAFLAAGALGHMLAGLQGERASGARQVATIGEAERTEDEIAASWFGPEGDARSYTYKGLAILTTEQGWDTAQQECIAVVPSGGINWQDGSINGRLYSGCSAGVFPATAEFTVEDTSPAELKQTHAVGTSLQFALLGGEVTVFADDGGAGLTSAAG